MVSLAIVKANKAYCFRSFNENSQSVYGRLMTSPQRECEVLW